MSATLILPLSLVPKKAANPVMTPNRPDGILLSSLFSTPSLLHPDCLSHVLITDQL